MFDKKTVGQKIRQLRTENNVKQDALACAIGISKQMLSNIETGYRDATLDVTVAIADYFGVSLDYLTGRSEVPRQENFISSVESLFFREAENLEKNENASISSVGRFMRTFYNSHKENYSSPLVWLDVIFTARTRADQLLNPKIVKVHIKTPKYLRKPGIPALKTLLQDTGFLPQDVEVPQSFDIEQYKEKWDELEKEYQHKRAGIKRNV